MQPIDTGKLTIELVDNEYLRMVIYTNEELKAADIPPVTNYLDQFDRPLPAIIERQGNHKVSLMVQIEMLKQASKRVSAVAYLDRDHKDKLLTRIAMNTYFKNIKVKSFTELPQAISWIRATENYAPEEK